MVGKTNNDLQTTISQAIQEMEVAAGKKLTPGEINLAELGRRTGITRKKLRKLKAQGFVVKPHANLGKKSEKTKISGFTGIIDELLKKGICNSDVILTRLKKSGYSGGLTQVKKYIKEHKGALMPAARHLVAPQGNRGRRYTTGPGESYQMDWGFLKVERGDGQQWQVCCFAMICHHCGERFVEFFPNAKQENLFIGMIHGFVHLGVPKYILTDNMKSVVDGRDITGHPLWNKEYEAFMKTIDFGTKLCKPRHPFTKGAVERLIKFVKNNFAAERVFGTITDLNFEVARWCSVQNAKYHRCVDGVPHNMHMNSCMHVARELKMTEDILVYLWPVRKISFDGFVSFEGRRFGVPYWYKGRTCRICREEYKILIYSLDLLYELAEYDVTWSRKDRYCADQYADETPEEFPTAPVATTMKQIDSEVKDEFSRFNFDREVKW